MKKFKKFLAVSSSSALLITTLLVTSCNSQPANITPKEFVAVDTSKWQFHDEQEWIVDSIGRDIAEILSYAKFHDDQNVKLSGDFLEFKTTCVDKATNKYRYHLVLPNSKTPLDYEFALNVYAWNPATYAGFAQKMMSALDVKPNSSSSNIPADFMKSLAQTDMASIWKENDRLTKALSEAPLDASLHQQAALLQATINMIELSGVHSDTRFPLNRMSAHLAIAQALNGDANYNIVGKVADVALESMSCRDGVSAKENDEVAKSEKDPVINSWLRALKIRSTGDYRIYDEANSTPLETSQYGLRYSNFAGSAKVIDFMEKHPDKCTPEIRWKRIIEIGGPSVGAGHQNTTGLFSSEFKELLEDYNLCHETKASNFQSLIQELNKTVTRCLIEQNGKAILTPLSWDDMAAYHARHIASAADDTYNFLEHRWCVHDQARQMIDASNRLLEKTDLLPFTMSRVSLEDRNKDLNAIYFSSMSSLMQRHPEEICCWDWLTAYKAGKESKPTLAFPKAESWFNPPYPLGTAFYFSFRKSLENSKPTLAELERLREICPLDWGICSSYAEAKYGKNPNSDQLREAYGKLCEFNLPVMQVVAAGDYGTPSKYIPQMEKIAAMDPGSYYGLGSYCVLHNEDDRAAKYFQMLVDKDEDSVEVSNGAEWLIMYYFDHGKKDEALKLATEMADVYSAGGLRCLALLYERMGKIDKAEETYRASKERYGESQDAEMTAFYQRNSAKNKQYAAKAAEGLKSVFPSGLQKLDLAQLKGAPKAGVWVEGASEWAKSKGLDKGSIVVGLNGYKVENQKQYFIVQHLPIDPTITATYWNGKEYKQAVIKTVIGNKLNIGIFDYPKKQ